MAQSARIPFWDNLKALLIFLVVLGHTGTALGDNWLSVIYAFHMPMFVFVSGYFTKRKTIKEYWRGVKRLIIIYLIFDTMYIGLDVVLGEPISFARIINPSFALWYILSLIYWRTFLQIIPNQVLQRRWLVISCSLVLALIAGFIPIGTQMSFQRTFVFLPFFLLGYYARESDVVKWIRCRNKMIMASLFFALCMVCFFLLPVFYAKSPYDPNGNGVGMRFLQIIIAIIMCGALLNLIPENTGKITDVGKYTLLIYLVHPPIVKLAKMACSYVGIPMTPNVPVAVIISLVTIALIYILRNFKLFRLIL